MARYYRGKKTKKEQYVDRRRSGMEPSEARRRTYLGEDVARRYEKAYQEVAKEDRIAASKAAKLAQEALDEEKRAQDEADRDIQDRQRRLIAQNEAKAASTDSGRPLSTKEVLAALPQPDHTEADKAAAAEMTRRQSLNMGLPDEWLEGWKNQGSDGHAPFEPGTYTLGGGFVSDSDAREAEFRADQERQRDQEMLWDPWKARMRKLGVL